MKFKNHVSNSNRNEDPLKNEKKPKDKALMTGQQKKVERICTLQDHLILNKNEKKKGSLIRKTGFKNHQREQKSSKKKGLYPHEDHTFGQRKMSKQTNDLSKPFQKRKRHRGKKKNH